MQHALVVDDDQQLLDSIKRLASTAGIDIATAENWDEGLTKFQALNPTVVVVDYNLPGSQHGLRLLLEMAQLRPSVRLVIMSAYLNDDDLAKVRELGLVDDAFRKTDSVATASRVFDLIEDASELADAPTDWVKLAAATLQAQQIPVASFESLDLYLKRRRLPNAGKSGR